MKNKYELLKDDTIEIGIHTLYRIKALVDFNNVKKGDLGGYIEKETNLSHTGNCWVYDDAKVFGESEVHDNASVKGSAIIKCCSSIYDDTVIGGNATIDNSIISHMAHIYGNTTIECSKIGGTAEIYGNAVIRHDVDIRGNVRVYGNAILIGRMYLNNTTIINGTSKIILE